MAEASTNQKTALITGASGGIGYQFARVFAREGYNCVLVARSEDKLQRLAADLSELHGVDALVLPKDLSHPEAPAEIYNEVMDRRVAVDVLVNNAGFAAYGFFWETDLAAQLDELQVNVVSLTHLTRLFVPDMVERGQGGVLNVASTAAFQPGPLMAVYYASKSYVLLFSEAIANELQGTGVTVTALCPGPTRTGFQERAGQQQSALLSGMAADPRTVAEVGYRGLRAGKSLVIPGFRNSLFAWLTRFGPRGLLAKAVRWAQEPRPDEREPA